MLGKTKELCFSETGSYLHRATTRKYVKKHRTLDLKHLVRMVKDMEVVVEECVIEPWQQTDHVKDGDGREHNLVNVEDDQEHKQPVSDGEDKEVAAYYDVRDAEEGLIIGNETISDCLECPQCGKKFEFKNSLSNHIKSHSDLKRFQCQDCGRRFKKEGDYIRHRNCCGAPDKYKCEKCEKTFMNMNSLTNHIRVHNNEKPFQCSNCSARFKKLGDMTNHEVKFECLDSCK